MERDGRIVVDKYSYACYFEVKCVLSNLFSSIILGEDALLTECRVQSHPKPLGPNASPVLNTTMPRTSNFVIYGTVFLRRM
jgi:hypothetical protein